jgi:Rieske Fe-S protein
MTRRELLERLVKGGAAVAAVTIAVPGAIFALSPVLRRPPREYWTPIGPLDDIPPGEVRRMPVELPRDDWAQSLRHKSVYVWRPVDGEVVVYARNCTDLSCPIVHDPGSAWFFCPCHGGIFSLEGEPMAGPPSRPLYRFANRLRDGILEIDLKSLPIIT